MSSVCGAVKNNRCYCFVSAVMLYIRHCYGQEYNVLCLCPSFGLTEALWFQVVQSSVHCLHTCIWCKSYYCNKIRIVWTELILTQKQYHELLRFWWHRWRSSEVRTRKQTGLDRGQTHCISLTSTLTYDLDIQSSVSHGHDLLILKRLRSEASWFKRQNIQMDRQMEAIALPDSLMSSAASPSGNAVQATASTSTAVYISVITVSEAKTETLVFFWVRPSPKPIFFTVVKVFWFVCTLNFYKACYKSCECSFENCWVTVSCLDVFLTVVVSNYLLNHSIRCCFCVECWTYMVVGHLKYGYWTMRL